MGLRRRSYCRRDSCDGLTHHQHTERASNHGAQSSDDNQAHRSTHSQEQEHSRVQDARHHGRVDAGSTEGFVFGNDGWVRSESPVNYDDAHHRALHEMHLLHHPSISSSQSSSSSSPPNGLLPRVEMGGALWERESENRTFGQDVGRIMLYYRRMSTIPLVERAWHHMPLHAPALIGDRLPLYIDHNDRTWRRTRERREFQGDTLAISSSWIRDTPSPSNSSRTSSSSSLDSNGGSRIAGMFGHAHLPFRRNHHDEDHVAPHNADLNGAGAQRDRSFERFRPSRGQRRRHSQ